MTLTVKEIDAVPGYINTTYAVLNAESGSVVKIFTSKEEAENFVNNSKPID